MRRQLVTPGEPMSRINITPVIGLALVLVLILLMTGPMFSVADVAVELPAAETRGPEDDLRVTITLGHDGRLAMDERVITPEALPTELSRKLSDPRLTGALVVVRADHRVAYADVRTIVAAASASGARRIAVATRQQTGAPS